MRDSEFTRRKFAFSIFQIPSEIFDLHFENMVKKYEKSRYFDLLNKIQEFQGVPTYLEVKKIAREKFGIDDFPNQQQWKKDFYSEEL